MQHNALIVEDAAGSLGDTYNGIWTGCFGDVSIVSMNGNNVFETEMRILDCNKCTEMAG